MADDGAGSGKKKRVRPAVELRWSKGARETFLRVLAQTYDVEGALTQSRLTWPQVCDLRALYPDFAARFEEVILAGYDRIEAMLLRAAGAGQGSGLDPALAQLLLKMKRAGRGDAGPARRAPPFATGQRREVDELMRSLAPLRDSLGQGDGADGAGADGTGPARAAGGGGALRRGARGARAGGARGDRRARS